MGQISETYASPGLRVGLLLQDHPGATYGFELMSGADLGIPDEFGGDSDFCVCTIRFPEGADHTAWKPVPRGGSADEWNILCTKTLGRALKRAGYPDDLKDLKALVLWRQRSAEIGAIESGHPPQWAQPAAAIEAGAKPDEMQAALTAAAVPTAEYVGDDDGDTAELQASLAELLSGLDAVDRDMFERFCEQVGVNPDRSDPFAVSAEMLEQLLGWFDAEPVEG